MTLHGMKRQKPEKRPEGGITVTIYTVSPKNVPTFWQVADYTEGKRKLRSFGAHADAVKEADRIAKALARGEAAGAAMDPEIQTS